jgi:hypothetical protein
LRDRGAAITDMTAAALASAQFVVPAFEGRSECAFAFIKTSSLAQRAASRRRRRSRLFDEAHP